MSKDAIVRRVEDKRVAKIVSLYEQAQERIVSVMDNAIQIGKELAEAKSELKHGQWITWVEDNLPFDVRQAQKYVKIHKSRDMLNTNSNSHLTIDGAVSYIAKAGKPKLETVNTADVDVGENPPEIACNDYMSGLNEVPRSSVDLLITDPPYFTEDGFDYEFAHEWLSAVLSKLKEQARAFIFIGAYPREIWAYIDILLDTDWTVDSPLVWTYRNTLGQTPKMHYNLNYQLCLHLYTEQSRPLDTAVTNEMFSVQDITAPDGRHGNRVYTWQKPDELARRLIKHTTRQGDLVIDPFAGSGTFILQAAKLGRVARGCDKSQKVCQIAIQRGCADAS